MVKIKKRKIYENNFNNSLQIEKKQNLIMKTIENRKKINSSLDKNNIYNSSNSRQRHTQYIKKENKKKDNIKEIYYQKPIIKMIFHLKKLKKN